MHGLRKAAEINDFRARYEGYKSAYKQLGINFAADSICMPKNLLKRAHIRRKFTFGDPDLEFRENNKQKEK